MSYYKEDVPVIMKHYREEDVRAPANNTGIIPKFVLGLATGV